MSSSEALLSRAIERLERQEREGRETRGTFVRNEGDVDASLARGLELGWFTPQGRAICSELRDQADRLTFCALGALYIEADDEDELIGALGAVRDVAPPDARLLDRVHDLGGTAASLGLLRRALERQRKSRT